MNKALIEPSILIGAIGALATAIAYLWRTQVAAHQDTQTKLQECEKDRENLWGRIAEMWEQLAKEGFLPHCEVRNRRGDQ